MKKHPHFIIDNTGKKISVVLAMKEFKSLIAELDELEDIKRYDQAKASGESSVPIDEAFRIIEIKRSNKN